MSKVGKHTSESVPRVSIGLPVFNGENYLAETLDSLLEQTFSDFELIISDNNSTDGTEEICRQYLRRDPRIRYQRQPRNFGAAWNHNRVIRLARGEYFKLAAHDDLCEPQYLARCVEEADAHPEHVVVFPKTAIMFSGNRRRQRYWEDDMDTANPAPNMRFHALLSTREWCVGFRVFGLMRRWALLQTPLFGDYDAADHLLMTRLGLIGPFLNVPDRLFLYRRHGAQSINCPDSISYYAWWGSTKRRVFPTWRYTRELIGAIAEAPLGFAEKNRCRRHLVQWMLHKRKALFGEVVKMGETAPALQASGTEQTK